MLYCGFYLFLVFQLFIGFCLEKEDLSGGKIYKFSYLRNFMKIVKVPTSLGSLNKNMGCERAPDEIVKQLHDFYLSENFKDDELNIEEVKLSKDNIDLVNKQIFDFTKNIKGKIIYKG